MKNKQFSVIIPLYNKAPYVGKAVESVLGQTYADWEMVVVDDGSSDSGGEIVQAIGETRIRVVRQENAGVGAARNRGVDESAAPYVCFLDADDWWEPTFLEEMAALIERYPDAGIYGTGYNIVKNGRRREAPIGWPEGFMEGEIDYCHVYARTLCMPLTSISVCMPRTVFDEMGGFPTDVKLGEDFLLWVHTALKHKVVMTHKTQANYNQDVDVAFRGTHHLHEPEHHMLWHLEDLEPLEQTNPDYKQMIDNLRTYGLQAYFMDKRYRQAARQELAKVDWSRQASRILRLYQKPVWYLKIRMRLLKCGSAIKQRILK